jgi:hypothetical protein
MDQQLILQHLMEISGILSDIQDVLASGGTNQAIQLADHAKRHIFAVFEADPQAMGEAVLARKALVCLLESE